MWGLNPIILGPKEQVEVDRLMVRIRDLEYDTAAASLRGNGLVSEMLACESDRLVNRIFDLYHPEGR